MVKTPEDETKIEKRSLGVRWLRWIFCCVIGVVVFTVLIWGGLQTRWAKDRLVGLIGSATADRGNYRVALTGLDGLLPFSVQLDSVTISDAKGAWLDARHVDISLKWAPLLAGMLDVQWVRIENLSISRFPESAEGSLEKRPIDDETPPISLPHVMVRELRITRIDLAEEVAGAPLAYTLRSHVKTGGRQIEMNALLQDLDRSHDALRLTATYDLGTRRIETALDYSESQGGLAAGLMGLSNAAGIGLQLKADGPLYELKGHLDLEIGGYGKAGLDVEVGLNSPLALSVDGEIQAENRIVPKDVRAALGGSNLQIHCRADVSSDRRIRIKAFTARAPSSGVSVEGTADLARGLMDIEAVVSPVDISPFLQGSGTDYQALGPVHLTAKGPFRQPEVTATTSLGRLEVQNATLKEISIEARAAFEKDYTGIQKTGALVTVKEVKIPQLPSLKGPLRVDVAAASPDFERWNIESLQLTAPEITASVQGARIDTETGDVAVDLLLQIDRLAAWVPPEAGGLNGHLVIRTQAEGNTATKQIAADSSMALTRLSGLPQVAEAAIGTDLTLDARTVIKEGVLTLEAAYVAGGHTELNADGRLDLGKGTFDVRYHLFLRDLSQMAKAMEMELSGEVEGRGQFSGAFEDFSGEMEMASERIQAAELDLKAIRMELRTEGLPGKPSGSLRVKAAALDQPLQLNTGFSWSGETLTLSGAEAVLPGIDLRADLDIAPEESRILGTAGGTVRSLELLRAITDLEVEGSGNFELKSGDSSHPAGLTLNAGFKDLRYNDHAISKLQITAAADNLTTLRGRFSLKAGDASVGNARLESIELEVRGDLENAVANMEGKGSVAGTGVQGGASNGPLSFSARLYTSHDDRWRFRLELFKALYRDLDVDLAHPATVTIQGQEVTLDDLRIHTAKGNLEANGHMRQEEIQASVRITELPMALLDPFVDQKLSGTVSARCDVSGLLTNPEVHAEAHMKGYRILRGDGRAPLLLNADLNADRRENRFEAGLSISGLDKVPFTATASVPVGLSLRPFVFILDKKGLIKGRLQGHLDLTILHGLPALADQTLSGEISVDMGAGGTMDEWGLNGGISIQDGHYENLTSGTTLSKINGRVHADGRTLRLTRLTATDGEAGTVALEGGITGEAPFPMDADLIFKEATLLRKKILTSTTSGKLDIAGTAKRFDLKGEIILDRTELVIPRRLPPDVVVIPVTEINVPPGMSPKGVRSPQDSRLLFMDISLRIPARFFVRGRGLDAEFNGQLTAKGPADNPVIRGTLHVVRGTFEFLTRTFHITDGQIAFDGATPPVPLLNITTQVNAGQIDAQVRITGRADDFRVTLTSQPPLPQDEIMANILFGQSVAKLNAFQAYQLAASISQLSGGGMPDIVGKTRSLLGVDRLSISGGDDSGRSDSGPAVSAGKYVSEGVYVGVEQELTDAKQDVVVEVDITPNFSVESRAGTRSGAGLGFNWKYDY